MALSDDDSNTSRRRSRFRERGHVVYRGDPLVYYELLLE
jgi:hypothetical protein